MIPKIAYTTFLVIGLSACFNNDSDNTPASTTAQITQFGYQIMYKDGKAGLVNAQGDIIIPIGEYHSLQFSDDGKTLVARHYDSGLMGFLDTTGKPILPFKYKKAQPFSEGLAGVSEDGKTMGFINPQGQWIIAPQYDWDITAKYQFTSGAVVVYKKAPKQISNPLNQQTNTIQVPQAGVINKNNQFIVPFGKYEEIDSFREGLAKVGIKVASTGVMDNGKMDLGRRFGFINPQGTLVIPTQYYDAAFFQEGLANVAIKDKYGFIDKHGKVVIPFEYDNVVHSVFINGYAPMIKRKGNSILCGYGAIDKNNRTVIDFEYELLQNIGEIDGFRARKCGKSDTIRLNYQGKRIK